MSAPFVVIGPCASSRRPPLSASLLATAVAALFPCAAAIAAELAPSSVEPLHPGASEHAARYSERTLVVGLLVDRDEARLVAYTTKDRPYVHPPGVDPPRPRAEAGSLQLELALVGRDGERHTRRVEAGPICFAHPGDAEPHVEGDTIVLHRDVVIAELPDLAALDRLEVAYHERGRTAIERRSLGSEPLSADRFLPTDGGLRPAHLASTVDRDEPPSTRASTAVWPEQLGDPDLFRIYGDPAEGDRRVNIVIVPDGYTYAEKAQMEAHADAMVAHFRNKTPFEEHDAFVNYTLVYAYSLASGTDQCDCGIVVDTAMGTRFPDAGDPCGGSGNRCLYFGGGCDTSGVVNITTAELRAPYRDETVVMVNTTRYGGCGGSRAVYSAGNSSATELAVHELGHSLGGLADEYSYTNACGSFAGEINTSMNPDEGAWREWLAELGPPVEGAQYYQQCIYRPTPNCEMRNLNAAFCPVCNQRWALLFFGHARTDATSPIASVSDSSFGWVGYPLEFSVQARLATGPAVTDQFDWQIAGPGLLLPPTPLPGTGPSYSHVFDEEGDYIVMLEVTADTNFVKPLKYGANVDDATWQVTVGTLTIPPEISGAGPVTPLQFEDATSIIWEDGAAVGAFTYNLYRGDLAGLPAGDYGQCLQGDLARTAFDEPAAPPPGTAWFYLVTGENPLGEGPPGPDGDGNPRPSPAACD